ncbi:MAG: hypothetical protein PVF70_03225 [Anaerolineales bacterium]
MSFRRLVLALTLIAIFTMAVRISVGNDTWWHLRAGAWMTENRKILRTDPFSLTRQGEPWEYPGWLSQVLLYRIHAWLGLPGLNLLTALMAVAAFAFLWRAMEAPPLLRAFVLLLAATASSVYWAARPHVFSFALTGAFLLTLERWRQGKPRALWALPLLMVLWVNLHGGFALGFLLLAVYILGEMVTLVGRWLLRRATLKDAWLDSRQALLSLAAMGAACVLAVCINPHGATMLLYPFKTVSIGALQDYIVEWQSPDFHRLELQPFLWLLMLTAAAMIASRKPKRAGEALLVAGFSYMGFVAGRNIATFALVASPVLARHAHAAIEPLLKARLESKDLPKRVAQVLNLFILALLTVAALVKIYIPLQEDANRQAVEAQFPAAAVSHIRTQQLPSPLFNSYNWGGYVLWELYPDHLSYVDGRTDLFGDEVLSRYFKIWRAEAGWEEILGEDEIRLVLIEPEAPLARVLPAADWRQEYADEQAVVFVREATP